MMIAHEIEAFVMVIPFRFRRRLYPSGSVLIVPFDGPREVATPEQWRRWAFER